MSLQDYKEIVATSAVITTMGQMLAGTLICKEIYHKGTTKGFDPMPFVGGIVMSLLMLRYACLLGEPAMININVFGLLINVAYMSVFYNFSPNKNRTVGIIGKALAFAAIFLGYSYWEHQDYIQFRFGIIVTILLMLLVASPLIHLGEVIQTKSTEILPFPLILMGTIVTSQWLLYGLIINDSFTIFQNAVGFILSAVQLSLFAIFPSTSVEPVESEAKKSSSSKKAK